MYLAGIKLPTPEQWFKYRWIRKVRADQPCEGIKWNRVALSDLYVMNGKPPRGIQDRAKCKLRAKYAFRALPRSGARSGAYCIHHLITQIVDYPEETARFGKATKKLEANDQ